MQYQFMEVSLACSDCEEMAAFFERLFDGKVIFRGGAAMLETTFVAEPLSLDRLSESGYRHDVAILEGPDHLYVELNEVHMPEGVDWF